MKTAIALSPNKSKFGPLFFSGELEFGIQAASELGFDGVEISLSKPTDIDIKSIKKLLDNKGLGVVTVATGQAYVEDGLYFCSPDDHIRELTVCRVKELLDVAAIFCSRLTIGGIRGKNPNNTVDAILMNKIIEAIGECCGYAEKIGVEILIEPVNHYEVSCIHTVSQGLELIRNIDHKSLKLLYDSYHVNMEEVSIIDPILTAGEFLAHVHFADNNRLVPGYGFFNFTEVIRVLEKINYQGYICIEALPVPDSYTAAKQAVSYLRALMN